MAKVTFDKQLVIDYNNSKEDDPCDNTLLCIVIKESEIFLQTKQPGGYFSCQLDETGIVGATRFQIHPDSIKELMQSLTHTSQIFLDLENKSDLRYWSTVISNQIDDVALSY